MLCLVILSAALAAGCQSTPTLAPKGRIVISVQEHLADSGRFEATVQLMNEVVIKLPAVAAADNVWTVVLNDARYFHQMKPVEMAPDGTGTATFLAIRQGRRDIRFAAVPPKGREVTSTQAYEIVLTVE